MKNIRKELIYFLVFLILAFYICWEIFRIENFKSKKHKTKENFIPKWIMNPFKSKKAKRKSKNHMTRPN